MEHQVVSDLQFASGEARDPKSGKTYVATVARNLDTYCTVTITGDQLDVDHYDPEAMVVSLAVQYRNLYGNPWNDNWSVAHNVQVCLAAACRFVKAGDYTGVSYTSDSSGTSKVDVHAPDGSMALEMTNPAAGGSTVEYFDPQIGILSRTDQYSSINGTGTLISSTYVLSPGSLISKQTIYYDGAASDGILAAHDSRVEIDLPDGTSVAYLFNGATGPKSGVLAEKIVYSGTDVKTRKIVKEYENMSNGTSLVIDMTPDGKYASTITYYSLPDERGMITSIDRHEYHYDGNGNARYFTLRQCDPTGKVISQGDFGLDGKPWTPTPAASSPPNIAPDVPLFIQQLAAFGASARSSEATHLLVPTLAQDHLVAPNAVH